MRRRSAGGVGEDPTQLFHQLPPIGVLREAAIEVMPGVPAIACNRYSTRATRASARASLRCRFSCATTTDSGSNPNGTRWSDANVRRNRPAAATSSSERAIWVTTSAPRTANLRSPATPLPPVRRPAEGATLFTPSTGALPATIAAVHATPAAKSRTRQSSVRGSTTVSRQVASCATSTAPAHCAITSPSAAPAAATMALSVNSRRATRHRDAPSASRTLSSR